MTGYFDHNATTPLSTAAREAWLSAQSELWQNASGLYRGAGAVKQRIEEAREAFAERFGCHPRRIIFNSGATEGCNAVMAREAAPAARAALSAIEHPAVVEPAAKWFGRGSLTELPVDSTGVVDLEHAERLIRGNPPALVSVMAANNETGVLQPWQEIARICREQGARFHCDATQWVGKLPDGQLGLCDWVSISAHKFGGPKGCGILILPHDLSASPAGFQVGGPQESGHRGGSENYPAIAAMLAALKASSSECDPAGREAFERRISSSLPGIRWVGAEAPRLANTSMGVMPAHANLKWLTRLDESGFAVSTGSACSAGRGNPSRTMAAMGLDHEEMGRVLRFSGGPTTGVEEWMLLAEALEQVWTSLQSRQRPKTKIDLTHL
jgi:cysteine desulfurase